MLYEYALEPKLLNNWDKFRYYYEKMGVSHGRLISRYPNNWIRLVYESLDDCSDLDRKRIEERLKEIKGKLKPRDNEWRDDLDWLKNAVAEHERIPFRAIIASESLDEVPLVLNDSMLDENEPLWKSVTDRVVPRTAYGYGRECCSTTSDESMSIIFIDPHFGPGKSRFIRPFLQFLRVAQHNRTTNIRRVEYHLKEDAELSTDFFRAECARLSPRIPVGIEVEFKRWRKRSDCERLHGRFI